MNLFTQLEFTHFICLVIGMILTSVFYHAHLYNGVIRVDLQDRDNPRFQLGIIKVDKLYHGRYMLVKIEKETRLTQK